MKASSLALLSTSSLSTANKNSIEDGLVALFLKLSIASMHSLKRSRVGKRTVI